MAMYFLVGGTSSARKPRAAATGMGREFERGQDSDRTVGAPAEASGSDKQTHDGIWPDN